MAWTVHSAEQGYPVVPYAGDVVILCADEQQARDALEPLRRGDDAHGLHLLPEKTHVGDCRRRGEGFEFLGYCFEAGRRWVRQKSLNKLKDNIRTKTKRTRGDSVKHKIAREGPRIKDLQSRGLGTH